MHWQQNTSFECCRDYQSVARAARVRFCNKIANTILQNIHLICNKLQIEDTWLHVQPSQTSVAEQLKATFHLTISMRGQRATGKIQRNNCQNGGCVLIGRKILILPSPEFIHPKNYRLQKCANLSYSVKCLLFAKS